MSVNNTKVFTRALGSSSKEHNVSAARNHKSNAQLIEARNNRLRSGNSVFLQRQHYSGSGRVAQQSNNSADTLMTLATLLPVGMQLAQSIGNLVSTAKSNKSSDAPNGVKPDTTGNAGNIKSGSDEDVYGTDASIGSMKDAKDSVELRQAIEEARMKEATMSDEISGLEKGLDEMKTSAEEAQTQIDTLNKDIKSKEKEIKQQKSKLESYETKRDSAKNELQKADSEYSQACEKYAQCQSKTKTAEGRVQTATTNVQTAQAEVSRLEALPDTIPGPDGTQIPNPQKAELPAAKAKLEVAEREKQQAEEQLKQAQTAEDQAKTNKENMLKQKEEAGKNLQELEDKVADAQKEVDKAQEGLDKLNNDLKELEQQRTEKQETVDAYEERNAQIEKKKKEQKALQSQIDKQQARLNRMDKRDERKETRLDNRIDKLQAGINSRANKINEDDGMSLKEKVFTKMNKAANEKVSKLQGKLEATKERLAGKEYGVENAPDIYKNATQQEDGVVTEDFAGDQGVKLNIRNGEYFMQIGNQAEQQISKTEFESLRVGTKVATEPEKHVDLTLGNINNIKIGQRVNVGGKTYSLDTSGMFRDVNNTYEADKDGNLVLTSGSELTKDQMMRVLNNDFQLKHSSKFVARLGLS